MRNVLYVASTYIFIRGAKGGAFLCRMAQSRRPHPRGARLPAELVIYRIDQVTFQVTLSSPLAVQFLV